MITEDDKKALDNLYDRCGSMRSEVEHAKKLIDRLETVKKIKNFGAYDLKIDLVGNYGPGYSSSTGRPRLETSFGGSSCVTEDVIDSLVRFYELEVDSAVKKLTSVVVIRTDKL